MPTTETLGQRLRRLRTERGLSQTELAGADTSHSYISLIEAGRRRPTRQLLTLLAARLDCAPELLIDGVSPDVAASATLELRYAELALHSGEPAEAERRLSEVIAGDLGRLPTGLVRRLRYAHASASERLGRVEVAIAAYEALRVEVAVEPDDELWLRCVVALCRCYREAGDFGHAIDVGEAALAALADLSLHGSDLAIELAATLLFAYYERGDLATAGRMATETIAAAERLGTRRARGAAYWNASHVALERNRPAEALALAERALAFFAEDEDERNLARLKNQYGYLLLRQDPPRVDEALPLLRGAAEQLAATASEVDVAYCETEIARAHLLDGRHDEAARVAESALRRLGEGRPRLEAPRARAVLAAARLAEGDGDGALRAYRRAADELRAMGACRQAAGVWRELGQLLEQMGRATDALAAYRQAFDAAGIPATPAVPAAVPVR